MGSISVMFDGLNTHPELCHVQHNILVKGIYDRLLENLREYVRLHRHNMSLESRR